MYDEEFVLLGAEAVRGLVRELREWSPREDSYDDKVDRSIMSNRLDCVQQCLDQAKALLHAEWERVLGHGAN